MNRRSHSILSFLPNFLALSSDLFYIRIELFSETCCCVTRERKINNDEFFRALKQNSPSNFHRFLSEANVFLFRRHRSFLMSRGDEFFWGGPGRRRRRRRSQKLLVELPLFRSRLSVVIQFSRSRSRDNAGPLAEILTAGVSAVASICHWPSSTILAQNSPLSLPQISAPRCATFIVPLSRCPVVSLSRCLVAGHRRPFRRLLDRHDRSLIPCPTFYFTRPRDINLPRIHQARDIIHYVRARVHA